MQVSTVCFQGLDLCVCETSSSASREHTDGFIYKNESSVPVVFQPKELLSVMVPGSWDQSKHGSSISQTLSTCQRGLKQPSFPPPALPKVDLWSPSIIMVKEDFVLNWHRCNSRWNLSVLFRFFGLSWTRWSFLSTNILHVNLLLKRCYYKSRYMRYPHHQQAPKSRNWIYKLKYAGKVQLMSKVSLRNHPGSVGSFHLGGGSRECDAVLADSVFSQRQQQFLKNKTEKKVCGFCAFLLFKAVSLSGGNLMPTFDI